MRTAPRHARTSTPRARRNVRPAKDTQQPASTPLRRAARAAYTRPDSSVPFERRPLARQMYWIRAVRRALEAALDLGELAGVITTHSQYDYDPDVGLYRCAACGDYLTRGWADHIATTIRAHFLGHGQQTDTGAEDGLPPSSAQMALRCGAPDGSTSA